VFFQELRVQWSSNNLIKEKGKKKKITCFSTNSHVFTLFGYELNSILGQTYWFGLLLIYGIHGTPFVMCTNEKQPHRSMV
jgi:hypothetical protein